MMLSQHQVMIILLSLGNLLGPIQLPEQSQPVIGVIQRTLMFQSYKPFLTVMLLLTVARFVL
jgi:hypothetical protein